MGDYLYKGTRQACEAKFRECIETLTKGGGIIFDSEEAEIAYDNIALCIPSTKKENR